MLRYVIKRFAFMLVTFVIIIFTVFVIVKSLPDQFVPPIGESTEFYDRLREKEGWDKPPVEQFFIWARSVIEDGDFGWSLKQNRAVTSIMFEKIPITVRLNIVPLVLSVPIGIGLGIFAVLKKNKIQDHFISTMVIFLISVPTFVLGILLQFLLVFEWQVLPSLFVATTTEFQNDFWFGIQSYIMPISVMTFASVAGWTRGVRAELTEQITSDYMLLARSKGLSKSQATLRHGLKNAMVPFAPAIFTEFIGLLGGSLIIEQIFRINGVGRVYLEAFNQQDYPLLMMNVAFYTIIGLTAAILADISYTIVDPRIRVGSGKRS